MKPTAAYLAKRNNYEQVYLIELNTCNITCPSLVDFWVFGLLKRAFRKTESKNTERTLENDTRAINMYKKNSWEIRVRAIFKNYGYQMEADYRELKHF